jgi:hypothetical protein
MQRRNFLKGLACAAPAAALAAPAVHRPGVTSQDVAAAVERATQAPCVSIEISMGEGVPEALSSQAGQEALLRVLRSQAGQVSVLDR